MNINDRILSHRYFPRLVARFEAKRKRAAEGDCWLWLGLCNEDGYGYLSIRKRSIGAHRVAWVLANGPIPDGLHVLHRCDNPPCCNPAHLFLGAHRENIADMVRKRRHAYGEKNGLAVLTVEQVRAIRADPRGMNTVAVDYGIHKGTVWDIRKRRRWAWLD